MYLSEKERDRRYGQLREVMAKENMQVILVVGNNHATGSPSFATGNFRYLTNFFMTTLYGILVFFREGNPILLVPQESQEYWAKRYSWIEDVRISTNYAGAVSEILEVKGLAGSRVGILSMESIPASTYLSLKKGLPNVEFFDAKDLLLPFRFIKSEEERRLMEKAAEVNDEAYNATLKKIRPGMKEYEIIGILEGYHRGNRADRTFNIISSGPFPISKEGVPFPAGHGTRAKEKSKKGIAYFWK